LVLFDTGDGFSTGLAAGAVLVDVFVAGAALAVLFPEAFALPAVRVVAVDLAARGAGGGLLRDGVERFDLVAGFLVWVLVAIIDKPCFCGGVEL
jgi:hypothetical protein